MVTRNGGPQIGACVILADIVRTEVTPHCKLSMGGPLE